MIRLTLFTLSIAILIPNSFAAPTRIYSPDRMTYVDVRVEDGRLLYNAGYRKVVKQDTVEVQLLEDSPLGLNSNVADWTGNLTLKETGGRPVRYEYNLRQGKQSHVEAVYQHQYFTVVTPQNKVMTVDFRVGNHNVAYRYNIPMQGETAAIVVTGETSGFNLPAGTTTFLSPQSDPMIGWKRTKPSYEEEYTPDEPVGTKSKYGHGYTFPCLFHAGDRGWIQISETGLDGRYCGSHLSEGTADGLYTIAFPMEGENNGFGSTGAQFGLPGSTPWRTITLGETLAPIVESTVTWDVVNELYEPGIQYEGGRSTWSWIIWQDASIVYADQITFIDLAAELGWQYCLIDGGWETNIGRERMEQLFAHAREKGVAPWVWYNSNGGWNDAPQCAKNCMYSPIVRKKEMKWLRDNGVKGIKVDFFAGDKQETIKLYEQILSDANDYGLQVIFHGCTLPRGWERMYPNYCSSEAVLASENLVFNQHFDDMEGFNATLHPFCRNAVGSMEFGGTVLQQRLSRDNKRGTVRRVSDVFELGTAIAFQSSVQNFALTPLNLDEAVTPKWQIDFMRQVPTTWDETRLVDGYPGKYIILARRNGDRWYVCALNALKEPLKVNVSLPMLAGKKVMWLDDVHGAREIQLDKRGILKSTIPAEGAIVLY